jgi:putative DNA primase/helicase
MSSQFSAQFIAKGLGKSQRHGKGWRACCPAHDDRDQSFDIEDGDKGPIFTCRTGCSQSAIITALRDKGLWWTDTGDKKKSCAKPSAGDQPNARPKAAPRRHPVAIYPYTDAASELRYQTVRFEPKDFMQRRPDGKGGHIYNLQGITPLPYRLPELLKAIQTGARVLITEGEKDVDRAAEIGITATCNHGGAGKFNVALVEHFRGARITIIPDNDRAGRGHCKVVATALQGTAASIDVLELPVPEKGDLADWLDAGGTAEQLLALPTRSLDEWLAPQPVVAETDDERLARLAALSPLELDRVIKAEAVAAGVSVRTLTAEVKRLRGERITEVDDVPEFLIDPEPWPEPVDGADLLNRIVDSINMHMVLQKGAAASIALWVLHAHAHDLFPISPILGITSPTPECGKSSLLTIISAMVPRALSASNVTASTIFRAVEAWRPTLLIDEADTFLSENQELRGILNSGHQRATAYVLRSVDTGSGHEPRRYATWCAKGVAMIGRLPSTLNSRAIRIELQRKARGASVKPLRADRLDHLTPLGQMAARWAADHEIQLGAIDPEMPPELGNRLADNWRPLIAIADVAGGDWPECAREIARGDRVPVDELGIMLLEDIKKIFGSERVDRIPSTILANKLVLEEDRPWVEYSYGKPISTRQIAELLSPFKIVPNTIRVGTTTPKGYLLKQFLEAFSVYTPDLSATPPQASESAKNQEKSSATEEIVLRHKKPERSSNSAACGGVAAKTLPSGEHHKNSPPKANGNGRNRCGHCGGSGDHIFKALDPDSNSHGWFHRECLKARAADHQKGPLS